jgi:hypothetical protein
MYSLTVASIISIFCIPSSNAMQIKNLRGEFLDIMGRSIVREKGFNTKKAFYLEILKNDQISTLVRKVTQELEDFNTNEYLFSQEQAIILKNIITLCDSLEVFLQRIPCNSYETIYAYPFHAQLAYAMKTQLSEFYSKIMYTIRIF